MAEKDLTIGKINDDDEYMDYAIDLAWAARQVIELKEELRDKLSQDISNESIGGKVSPVNRNTNVLDEYSRKYDHLMALVDRLRREYLETYRPANAPKVAELLKGHIPE